MRHSRWPAAASPGKPVVNLLPQSVLHQLVADLPGPRDETDAARAARFDAQLAEVLSYNPRDVGEAMLATHCIMLRLVADDARRDASRATVPAEAKQHLRSAKQLDKQVASNKRLLADFQSRPLRTPDPAILAAIGLKEFLIPDPAGDAEEAHSAIIVPLHPAPKTLQ
jgi:hypothetical protein